jgi:thiosulfate reductase cytochrome b subunit
MWSPHRNKTGGQRIMSAGTKRSIVRWIHLVLGIPIIGYVYSPFENIPQYAPLTRFVFLPLLILTGLWMWKGHLVTRMFSRRAA